MAHNEQEGESVTASTYGSLETFSPPVTDECWMIRIPQALAQAWDKVPEGTVLGDLVFTKGGPATGPGGKPVRPSFSVHVSEDLQAPHEGDTGTAAAAASKPKASNNSSLPLKYSLQAMTKKIPVLHPFVRNPRNGAVNLLGTVSRTGNLQVEQDQTYRALLKDRLVATNLTSSRFVKPVEAAESVMNKKQTIPSDADSGVAGIPGANKKKRSFGDDVLRFGQRQIEAAESMAAQQRSQLLQKAQGPGSKKARQFSPDDSLRSVLFALFQQQQYWSVKDIKAAAAAGGATHATSKKAEAEIRDLLREIGDYHRSGDHKNTWELKPHLAQSS